MARGGLLDADSPDRRRRREQRCLRLDLQSHTFLASGRDGRVSAVHYEPPHSDWLGAKFYFPRYLPGGTPLITAKDKELKFETRIGGRKIKAKFDLRKLQYKGTLEI